MKSETVIYSVVVDFGQRQNQTQQEIMKTKGPSKRHWNAFLGLGLAAYFLLTVGIYEFLRQDECQDNDQPHHAHTCLACWFKADFSAEQLSETEPIYSASSLQERISISATPVLSRSPVLRIFSRGPPLV